MGLDDLDQMGGHFGPGMSPQLMEKLKKTRKKHKNKNKNKSTTTTTSPDLAAVDSGGNIGEQQQKLQKLIEQMEQHLQQQQQLADFKGSLPQYGNNDLPVYGSNELPQYGSTSRPVTVTFPSSSPINPSVSPVAASFPFAPIQTTPTPRPIQTQYVSSTTVSSDGLPEYNPGLSQYGSSSFQNDLPIYNRPSSRPTFVSTSSPIEQAQYNIVSTPSQVQYSSQDLPQYNQNDDLPQYFGNQQPSSFRGSPTGESWFPVNQNQNQDQFQSSYSGSAAAGFVNSKPVRFPSSGSSSQQQYSSISRQDPGYDVIHYDDEGSDDWYDPLTHSYHQPSAVAFDKSSGPLVPPPTYGKSHLQSLDSSRPSVNIIAELAKYSNKKNILGQSQLGRDPYIISDAGENSDGSKIIMYPSGNETFE